MYYGKLIGIAVLAAIVSREPNKTADPNPQPTTRNQSGTSKASPSKQDEAAADQAKSRSSTPEWYASLERPDWWLVIVGFGTLIVVGSQTWILGKSVQVAQDAANAAKASADAYQMSERAWLTSTRFEAGNALKNNKKIGTLFYIFWINKGNTPAINCSLVTEIRATEELNVIPSFTPPPNTQQRQAPIVPGVEVHGVSFVNLETIEGLKKGTCRIFMYSRADYELIYTRSGIKHTEACIEITLKGTNNAGENIYGYSPTGPQNSAI